MISLDDIADKKDMLLSKIRKEFIARLKDTYIEFQLENIIQFTSPITISAASDIVGKYKNFKERIYPATIDTIKKNAPFMLEYCQNLEVPENSLLHPAFILFPTAFDSDHRTQRTKRKLFKKFNLNLKSGNKDALRYESLQILNILFNEIYNIELSSTIMENAKSNANVAEVRFNSNSKIITFDEYVESLPTYNLSDQLTLNNAAQICRVQNRSMMRRFCGGRPSQFRHSQDFDRIVLIDLLQYLASESDLGKIYSADQRVAVINKLANFENQSMPQSLHATRIKLKEIEKDMDFGYRSYTLLPHGIIMKLLEWNEPGRLYRWIHDHGRNAGYNPDNFTANRSDFIKWVKQYLNSSNLRASQKSKRVLQKIGSSPGCKEFYLSQTLSILFPGQADQNFINVAHRLAAGLRINLLSQLNTESGTPPITLESSDKGYFVRITTDNSNNLIRLFNTTLQETYPAGVNNNGNYQDSNSNLVRKFSNYVLKL